MASTENHSGKHRLGGRTARVTRQIHAAVLDLLMTRGHEACIFQNVAMRAGVERSTLYRRYPDRWAMIIDAYAARAGEELSIEPTGEFARDFKLLVRRFAQLWSTRLAEAILTVVLAVRGTSAQDRVNEFLERRFGNIDPMFDAAIARRELRPTIDRKEMLERAAGAVIFHILIRNELVDEPWIDRLVDDFVRLYSIRQEETAS